jgi:hypothetical protein
VQEMLANKTESVIPATKFQLLSVEKGKFVDGKCKRGL